MQLIRSQALFALALALVTGGPIMADTLTAPAAPKKAAD